MRDVVLLGLVYILIVPTKTLRWDSYLIFACTCANTWYVPILYMNRFTHVKTVDPAVTRDIPCRWRL